MQEGRNIEICNSFELLVKTVEGKTVHDADYFIAKEKQCMADHYTCSYVLVTGYHSSQAGFYNNGIFGVVLYWGRSHRRGHKFSQTGMHEFTY